MHELAQPKIGDGDEVGRRPESTSGALGLLHQAVHGLDEGIRSMIEHAADDRIEVVLQRRTNAFELLQRLRRAQEIQRLRSAAANSASLCERASAYTSRNAIFSRQASLNARMCDALVDISLDGDAPFLLGIDWATSLTPSDDVLQFADHLVSERHVSLLRYVSERLKVVEPQPDRIVGQVVNLHCVSDPVRGNAKRTIAVKVNHEQHGTIEVKLSLGPHDYLLAIDAHSKGKWLAAAGQLQRKGNSWTLEPVSEVSIVDA